MAVTVADVARWGKFPTPDAESEEYELLERVIEAVTARTADHFVLDEPLTVTQEVALFLQISRLIRRRDTPEGLAEFADIAAIRVAPVDGDAVALLDRNWGFA